MSVKHDLIDLNADAVSVDREKEVDTPVIGDFKAETLEECSNDQVKVQDTVVGQVRVCGSAEVICDLNIGADDVSMSSGDIGREVDILDSVIDVKKDNEFLDRELGVEAAECMGGCGNDVSMRDDHKAECTDVVERASGQVGMNHDMNGGLVGEVLEQGNGITGNSSSSDQDARQSPTNKSEEVSEMETSSDVLNGPYGVTLEVDLNACCPTDGNVADRSMKLIPSKQNYRAPDLVWGKVRSHPWWPGQIFAPSAASKKAKKYFKKDSYLIAYFGDQTFAWNEPSKIKHFRDHFMQMENQSSLEDFHCAVDCALEEVSRRVEFGLACSCIPEEALTEIKTQIIVNAGVEKESSTIDGGDSYSNAASFDPVQLFERVKALAQLLHYSAADRLGFVTIKAQLSAFYRWKGYFQLPEFNVLGGLLDSDAEIPISGELKHSSEVTENAAPDSKDDKQASCGSGMSNSQDGSSRKRKQISRDTACASRKEKSLLDLLAERSTIMSNGKRESDGKDGKLISSTFGKRQKAIDSTSDDVTAKHRNLDSVSDNMTVKQKKGEMMRVKHEKSDLSTGVDKCLPNKRTFGFGVGNSILKVASQLNGLSPILKCQDGTSPKTVVNNKRNEKSDLRNSQCKKQFLAEGSSTVDFLSQLCLAAGDPMTRYSFLMSLVSFFSKFRNSVSLELSQGDVSGDRTKKMLTKSETAETPESDLIKDSVIERIPEEQQPLEIKNQVEVLCSDPSQKDVPLVEAQSAVHLSANMDSGTVGETLELEAVKPADPLDGCCNEELSPTALILNFTDSESVPSKENLNDIFGRFGPLNELETEVLKSRRAKVVFKKRKDAETAFSSAGKYSIFGPALVSYCLKYMSSTTSKASSRSITKRSRKVAISIEGNAT
ncbi:uncharacterized protein LOC123226707 isoform X2 [Mangifera indica]|uniref:uncharacterized protein LOC123226707 isoform X2 n=1 Tax=Mangifera indica TaxID=29780 RepID=UPI001CFB2BA3|nr:uncharacterized protein LOC123226707 isoform X2 [Mangifera indica]